MEVTDVNAAIILAPGEYRMYTDMQLEKPDINSFSQLISNNPSHYDLFPNPSEGVVHFVAQTTGNLQFDLYRIDGEHILDKQIFAYESEKVVLDIRSENMRMNKGIYIYKITDSMNTCLGKLVVQ